MFQRSFLLIIFLLGFQNCSQAKTVEDSRPWDSEHFRHYTPDLNGDGIPDIFLHAKQKSKSSICSLSKQRAGDLHGAASTQEVATSNQYAVSMEIDGTPWSASEAKLVFADFNGDKRDDLLVVLWSQKIAYLMFTPIGGLLDTSRIHRTFDDAQFTWFTGGDDHVYHVGDFDGSGTADLLVLDQRTTNQHYIFFSTKKGDLLKKQSFEQDADWTQNKNYRLKIADFNGDGREDIFALARRKNLFHRFITTQDQGKLDVKGSTQIQPQINNENWNAKDFSVIVDYHPTKKTHQLLKMQNMQGGIDEEGAAWHGAAPEPLSEKELLRQVDSSPLPEGEKLKALPNCEQTYFFPKNGLQGKTCAPFAENTESSAQTSSVDPSRCNLNGTTPGTSRHRRCDNQIPRAPTSPPHISRGSYHAVGSSVSITMNVVTNGVFYELYESRNNIDYERVYRAHRNTDRTTTRSYNSYGYVYYKYRACSFNDCGGFSPWKRIYVYTAPGRSTVTSPSSVIENQSFSVSLSRTGGAVPGASFNLFAKHNSGSERLIKSWTMSNYGSTPFVHTYPRGLPPGSYRFRSSVCNPNDVGCGGPRYSTTKVAGAPVIAQGDITLMTINEGTSATISLNASDPNGDPLTWSISSQARHGRASASGTGTSKTVRYTPNANYSGSDWFVVRVSDGSLSDTIRVNVTVSAQNDAPRIGQGSSAQLNVNENSSGSLTLTASDPDSSTLTWSISSQARHGRASASGTGTSKTVRYTPNANYSGSDWFVVRVSDGSLSDTIRVNVTVSAQNNAPVIEQGAGHNVSLDEGDSSSFALTARDPDGDSLSWSISLQPSKGSVSVSNRGNGKTITYRSTVGRSGSDRFVVRVTDGSASDTYTVSVNVKARPQNSPPSISGSPPTFITSGQRYRFAPIARDVDGDSLSFSISNKPSWASFNSASGVLTGVPSESHVGTFNGIRISVSDGQARTYLPTFNIEVKSRLLSTTYQYDPLGRLIEVNVSNGEKRKYDYDKAGNRKNSGSH